MPPVLHTASHVDFHVDYHALTDDTAPQWLIQGRSEIQRKLGYPMDDFCNACLIWSFCTACAACQVRTHALACLCPPGKVHDPLRMADLHWTLQIGPQEARAVDTVWLANGRRPLGTYGAYGSSVVVVQPQMQMLAQPIMVLGAADMER